MGSGIGGDGAGNGFVGRGGGRGGSGNGSMSTTCEELLIVMELFLQASSCFLCEDWCVHLHLLMFSNGG
jgi:hypothetical protein